MDSKPADVVIYGRDAGMTPIRPLGDEMGDTVAVADLTGDGVVDLILGASTDQAMTGRAQAILIVTGVGGQPAPTEAPIAVLQPVVETVSVHSGPPLNPDDLDLPTFLRRRVAVQ